MLKKIFLNNDIVVQYSTVRNENVECEASVPYTSSIFIDERKVEKSKLKRGSTVEQNSDGEYVFSLPEKQEKTNTREYPKVSPTQFKLLLTGEERISLRGAVETDPGIADLFDLVDDPRTSSIDLNLSSVQEAIDYALNFLESEGVVSDVVTRKEEILSGKLR